MSGTLTGQSMIDFRKQYFADERDDNLNEIGKPTRRQDITGHVTGRSPFYDDHLFEGLLHMRCARSPHHAARIRRIDTTAAERMPGVVRVLTGKDVPRSRCSTSASTTSRCFRPSACATAASRWPR
jgi:CO/xanthine dehydrogenase Mo-binding subunit